MVRLWNAGAAGLRIIGEGSANSDVDLVVILEAYRIATVPT